MKKWFVFDVDDSLGNFTQTAFAKFNHHFGTNHCFTAATYYNKTLHNWDLDVDTFYRLLHDHRVYQELVPYPGVARVLQGIARAGFGIQIVTARNRVHNGKGYELTEQWLCAHGIPFHKLTVTHPEQSKVGACHEDALLIVEDSVQHLANAAEIGRLHTVKVEQPWNESAWAHTAACPETLAETLEELCHRQFSKH